MRPKVEDSLTHALSSVRGSKGVEIVSLEVWSEGPRPCKEHCWHPVLTSMKHKIAAGERPESHEDFTCCRCTHGLCRLKAHANVK